MKLSPKLAELKAQHTHAFWRTIAPGTPIIISGNVVEGVLQNTSASMSIVSREASTKAREKLIQRRHHVKIAISRNNSETKMR